MRAAFDLEARKLLNWNLAALAAQTVRRRDLVPIELKAVKGAEGLALPTDVTIYAAVKSVAAGPQGPALAVANTFTVSGTGSSAVYSLLLNLNTSGINGLFSTETAAVPCVLEVELVSAQFRLTAEALPLTVQNDYARESDEDPTALPDNKATQAEAEAGENNGKWMTPLRVAQAIEALAERGGGGGTANFTLQDSDFNAEAGGCYLVDTEANGASAALLPPNPALGDRILFADARGSWDLEPLTIDRNGKLIDGFAVNFVAATSGMYFEMVFVDNTTGWRILAAGSKPINLTAPVMTVGVVSSEWSCGEGEWTASPTNFLYQWQSSGGGDEWGSISGATNSTFSPDESLVGQLIRCAVTAVNSNGNSTPAFSNSGEASMIEVVSIPEISGNTAGSPIAITNAAQFSASGADTFNWQISDDGLTGWSNTGSEGATYTPSSGDVGKFLRVIVTRWPSGEQSVGSSASAESAASEAIVAPPFPSANIRHFFAMNSDPADGAVADSTASGATMNVTGNMGFVTGQGKVGNCVHILPADDPTPAGAFSPSTSITVGTNGAFTIALWFKIPAVVSSNHMFAADDGYSNLYFMEHGGALHVSWGMGWVGPTGSGTFFSVNTWYHTALTLDASGNAKLYINGVQRGSLTGISVSPFNIIPCAGPSGAEPFLGHADCFGVWDRALTESEVGMLYNGGAGAEL